MKNFKIALQFILQCGIVAATITNVYAQFNFNFQLIQRAEYRNGYGKLISENADPAAFISQRFRIQGLYNLDKLSVYAALQDVRTWGSRSQLITSDPSTLLYEAWVNLRINGNLSLKLGRQELNYDNVRFLGNSDWLLQGRSHDFGLLRLEKKYWKLHIGAGYNQQAEHLQKQVFNVQNQYKTAQLIRFEQQWKKLDYALLFWNDGREVTSTDSVGSITKFWTRYSQTVGISTLKYAVEKLQFSGFYYYQFGKHFSGKNLKAFDIGMQVSYSFKLGIQNLKTFRLSLGTEVISGTTSNTHAAFTPLYGTGHIHNGYMDYFYNGGRHENSTGLQDYYLKTRYDFSDRWFVSGNFHRFSSYADIVLNSLTLNKYFGTEMDFSAVFKLNQAISFQGGYSQFISSKNFQEFQGVRNPKLYQNWMYLMIIVRPDSDKKFIGLSF
ncbi:MAG: alginate export family protein [Bacteroidota bacterium]|nr:alginate export family protein [Bacteroidota bacterium]